MIKMKSLMIENDRKYDFKQSRQDSNYDKLMDSLTQLISLTTDDPKELQLFRKMRELAEKSSLSEHWGSYLKRKD